MTERGMFVITELYLPQQPFGVISMLFMPKVPSPAAKAICLCHQLLISFVVSK